MGLVLVIVACHLQISIVHYQPHKDKYILLDRVLVIVLKEALHVILLAFFLMAQIVIVVVDGALKVVMKLQQHKDQLLVLLVLLLLLLLLLLLPVVQLTAMGLGIVVTMLVLIFKLLEAASIVVLVELFVNVMLENVVEQEQYLAMEYAH
jgi:hypothetical protein